MTEPILEWESYSREAIERSDDWFWALGAIAVFSILISLFFGNILLALIIGLGAFSLYYHERRPTDNKLLVKINKKGVQLNKELFTYEKINSFWVEEENEEKPAMLTLHYRRLFVPNIHIPIVGYSPEEVRQTMLEFGEEEKHVETFSEVIFDTLGF
jgi:hypothetical protein